jgi:hypothetical protein
VPHLLQVVHATLPVAFALHNLEELRGFDQMRRLYYRRIPFLPANLSVDRSVFRSATAALDLAVAAIFACRYFVSSNSLDFLIRTILCALLINSVQHIAISLVTRTPQPGIISATVLLLPLCVAGLSADASFFHLSEILTSLAAGALLLPTAALASLAFGLLLRKITSSIS